MLIWIGLLGRRDLILEIRHNIVHTHDIGIEIHGFLGIVASVDHMMLAGGNGHCGHLIKQLTGLAASLTIKSPKCGIVRLRHNAHCAATYIWWDP